MHSAQMNDNSTTIDRAKIQSIEWYGNHFGSCEGLGEHSSNVNTPFHLDLVSHSSCE